MFQLLGVDKEIADSYAVQIFELEKQFAKHHLSKVELRNPDLVYHKLNSTELQALTPFLKWDNAVNYDFPENADFIVDNPDYLLEVSLMLNNIPLDIWRVYYQWRVLTDWAPYLSTAFDQEDFDFFGRKLSGQLEQKPRWKRMIECVNSFLGEALSQLYVKKHFSERNKNEMLQLVNNLLCSTKDRILELKWMSEPTKLKALEKLNAIGVKIGYPDKWIDYSRLVHNPKATFLEQILNCVAFKVARDRSKWYKPVDRSEWFMTAQTINAYYSPEFNEIVFPAAILQKPFFFASDSDVVGKDGEDRTAENYGSIGAIIGHEITHGFDDSGRKYDFHGNLTDWWSADDVTKFTEITQKLVLQYNQCLVHDQHVNGELTLGENIADNAGLVMAIKAYHLSLEGKPAPVIDGYSAEQRLFFGLAQARRFKARESRAIMLVKTDPHSPGEFRVNGSLRNTPEFYSAFDVKPGDNMYLPPEQRVKLW